MPTTTPINPAEESERDDGQTRETSSSADRRTVTLAIQPKDQATSSGGESDEYSGEEASVLGRQMNNELKKRRKTIVNSFRLAELIPTQNTPYSSYRRKSVYMLTAQSVVESKADEQ